MAASEQAPPPHSFCRMTLIQPLLMFNNFGVQKAAATCCPSASVLQRYVLIFQYNFCVQVTSKATDVPKPN